MQDGFRNEAEMALPVERWLVAHGCMVRCEFRTPEGVADVVGCALDRKHVAIRKRLGLAEAIGPTLRIALWHAVPDEGSGQNILRPDLYAAFGDVCGSNELEKHLTRLLRAGFVSVDQTGAIQKRNSWYPLQRRLVAVELKMNRIKDATDQASRYLAFADESYVALPLMPARNLTRSGRIQLLARSGVGLLGLTPYTVHVLLRPDKTARKFPVDLLQQIHAVERFWTGFNATSN